MMSFFKKKEPVTLSINTLGGSHVLRLVNPSDIPTDIGYLLSRYGNEAPFVLSSHSPTSLVFSTVEAEESQRIDEELDTIKFLLEGHFKKSFMAKNILLFLYEGRVITTRPDDGWNESYLRNLKQFLKSNGYTGEVTVQKLSVQKNIIVDKNDDGDLSSRMKTNFFDYDIEKESYIRDLPKEEEE